jgi:hypothetical protein
MFNDYLANEEAKQRIERRVQEAETYRLLKRLGYRDRGVVWVITLIALIAAVALGLLP